MHLSMWFLAFALINFCKTQNDSEYLSTIIDKVFAAPDDVDEDACECVPFYLCENGTINIHGENVIDLRFKGCENNLQICCKLPSILDHSSTTEESENITSLSIQTPNATQKCGLRNSKGVEFSITGSTNEAQYGEFPWMVAILHVTPTTDKKNLKTYKCGGSLIHPQVILTAAHCMKTEKNLVVRAGEWDYQHEEEPLPHQERYVKTIVKHPQFNKYTLFYDVALLILQSPFNITNTVNTVCLPPSTYEFTPSTCYATGWGKDSFGIKGKYQIVLKKVDLPLVNNTGCQDALRKTRLGNHFLLHPTFVCAGGEGGKDVCTGDGGSPLACPIDGNGERYQEIGIVAWGIGCKDETPGIYANVAKLRDWIDEEIVKNNFTTSSYTI